MTTKYEYVKTESGTIVTTYTHIMSEHGHFEKDGHRQGCHISSTGDLSGYTEVIDEGVTHVFPESFPDIIISDEEYESILAETNESEVTEGNEE